MHIEAFGRFLRLDCGKTPIPAATSFSVPSNRHWSKSPLLRKAALLGAILVATNGEPSKVPGFVRGLAMHPQRVVDSTADLSGCERNDYPSFTKENFWPPTHAARSTFHSLMLGGKCLVTGQSTDTPQQALTGRGGK
jgi:hypothetical protein